MFLLAVLFAFLVISTKALKNSDTLPGFSFPLYKPFTKDSFTKDLFLIKPNIGPYLPVLLLIILFLQKIKTQSCNE